jgi:hypothetical protein
MTWRTFLGFDPSSRAVLCDVSDGEEENARWRVAEVADVRCAADEGVRCDTTAGAPGRPGRARDMAFRDMPGDVTPLDVNMTGLTGTNITVELREHRKATVPLGVALTLDGVTTSVLDYDASVGDVVSELNGLARVGQNVQGDGGLVLVDRRLTSTNRRRAYERRVAFPTSARDASALFADGAGLSDTAAAINVMTRTNGEFVPLQFGTVTDYTRRATFCLVSYDASAAALEAALKSLTRVGDIVVARRCRSEYGSAGYEWNVTFTTLGAPTHAGAVQLLRVASASRLEGTRPVAAQHVDEVVAGYGPSVALERSVNGQQYASDQLLFEYHEPILVGAAVAPTLGLSGGGGGGRESILGGGGGGASAGQRGLVGSAAAVVGVLCLCRAARKRRPPLSVVALLLPLLLLLLARRVGATTCSEALASDYSCYDPAGASCTCTGYISLGDYDGLTGTLPAALSACTGVTRL